MPDIGVSAGAWNKGTDELNLRDELEVGKSSRYVDQPLAVPLRDQYLELVLEAWGYKLASSPEHNASWFAINGSMRHGIIHSQMPGVYQPADNWLSVGFYASQMRLDIVLGDPGAGSAVEFGPTSTVGTVTTSWNIGGNLTAMLGDISGVNVGVSAGFSKSYSTPAVTTAAATMRNGVRWDITLPGVGVVGPNPTEPSFAGFDWKYGIIFKTAADYQPTFHLKGTTSFFYDHLRGTHEHAVLLEAQQEWSPNFPDLPD